MDFNEASGLFSYETLSSMQMVQANGGNWVKKAAQVAVRLVSNYVKAGIAVAEYAIETIG